VTPYGTGHNDGGQNPTNWLFKPFYGILYVAITTRKAVAMCKIYTREELNQMDVSTKDVLIDQLTNRVNQLELSYENLAEQIRIANQHRFGRHTEKLEIDGQMSLFNEAERLSSDTAKEPDIDTVIPKKERKKKQKGKREQDLKDFPVEPIDHDIPKESLDAHYGEGNWREMPEEKYKRLRYEPASWTVEEHTVHVYVGKDGLHQDEFLRGNHPKDLLRNSILTPSLGAAIMNGKYVNSLPLNRIEAEFKRNGLAISKQTMANWMIRCSDKYLQPLYDVLKEVLLSYPVTQSDETPVEIIHDNRPAGSKSYMWVHRSGELYTDRQIILFEYQKTRSSDHPKEFYKDYHGVLMTDGLEQYHKIARELEGVTNANCFAHARRFYADAVKALGKADESELKETIAYQALLRIGAIYKGEGTLKELPGEERLRLRQTSVRPLVEEYFAWVKERLADKSCPPKGKTAQGLRYSVNQEEYLKVFLTNADVPIDNSATERGLRNFSIGRKNWVLINSIKGARSSAVIYSVTETAKLNQLNIYYYLKYLLETIPSLMDEEGNVEKGKLEPLLPWSKSMPSHCYKPSR
jgi:transposase